MKDKLRLYIEDLFREAPPLRKAVELKEEILQNLTDKYDDLIIEGKSEEAAYNIAIASVGDISGLLDDLKKEAEFYSYNHNYNTSRTQVNTETLSPEEREKRRLRSALMTAGGVVLCILSLVPVILIHNPVGIMLMFVMVAAAVGLFVFGNGKQTRSTLMIALGVMLCILSVIPPIVIHNEVGPVLMFAMIAAAVGLFVFNHKTRPVYHKADDTIVEEFREWKDKSRSDNQMFKALSGALWSIITALYFVISFLTGAWYITWVMFLIGGALEGVLKAIYDIAKNK